MIVIATQNGFSSKVTFAMDRDGFIFPNRRKSKTQRGMPLWGRNKGPPDALSTASNAISVNSKQNEGRIRQVSCWPWPKRSKYDAPSIAIRRHSLGAGGHSSVVSGEYGEDRQPVAVKLLSVGDPHSRKELLAFKRVGGSHQNVVEAFPHGSSPRKTTIYLPMELCDGSLVQAAEAMGGLEEAEIACIMLDVLAGLTFLHSKGIYHLDIKPDNILLKDGVAKLADLGAAVFHDDEPPATLR